MILLVDSRQRRIQSRYDSVKCIIALLFAYCVTLYPLSSALQPWRPQWVCVIALFWACRRPTWLGLFAFFLLGLFLDVISGAMLGLHALLFSLTAYALQKWRMPFAALEKWQQALVVGVWTAILFLLSMWVPLILGQPGKSMMYLGSCVSSALLWWILSVWSVPKL